MGDFFQTGAIATFHRLGMPKLDKIERDLKSFSKWRPIALVLPALFDELEGEALPRVLDELKKVHYLRQIVVSLDRANAEQFAFAKQFFRKLNHDCKIIWQDGPRLVELYKQLEANGLSAGESGKGRGVWMAFGYVIAGDQSEVIALHDCDIITYSRELLARLVYPVASPNLPYEFCKGYYSRVTDRMHGRVTRLLVTPLIHALKTIAGPLPYLSFMDSFRYALAGEFALLTELARVIRIPGDWGLEVGLLSEVFHNVTVRRVCQIDIIDQYEHKHNQLSPNNPQEGLLKMCIDIAKSIFRNLANEGVVLSDSVLRTLQVHYLRTAQDMLKLYEDDAAINGLNFDRHAESEAVEAFTHGIREASDIFLKDPFGAPLIPNWNRVTSAIPGFLENLQAAVDEDNRMN
jgi:glucosyl-3-phosphoglycerate synthase